MGSEPRKTTRQGHGSTSLSCDCCPSNAQMPRVCQPKPTLMPCRSPTPNTVRSDSMTMGRVGSWSLQTYPVSVVGTRTSRFLSRISRVSNCWALLGTAAAPLAHLAIRWNCHCCRFHWCDESFAHRPPAPRTGLGPMTSSTIHFLIPPCARPHRIHRSCWGGYTSRTAGCRGTRALGPCCRRRCRRRTKWH